MGKVCDPTHTRPHTPHKNTRVICSTPKTLWCVPHFPVILSVSTVVTTLLIVALVKCFVCLCSTFYLLFFSHIFTFSFSCTCYLLYTLKQSQNYCAYQAIQVFIVFLRLTINTVDALPSRFLLSLCVPLSSVIFYLTIQSLCSADQTLRLLGDCLFNNLKATLLKRLWHRYFTMKSAKNFLKTFFANINPE